MSILDLTDDEARALFHDLTAQAEAIQAASAPLREARDVYVQETDAKRRIMDAELLAAETGLFDIQQKRARIARMLGGKTGAPR